MRQRQNLFVFTLCSEWVRKLTFGLAETMGLVGLVRYYLLEILFACFSFTARSFLLTFLVSRALLDRKVKYFVSEMDKFISGVKGGAVIEGWHEHWRRDKLSLPVNLCRLFFLSARRNRRDTYGSVDNGLLTFPYTSDTTRRRFPNEMMTTGRASERWNSKHTEELRKITQHWLANGQSNHDEINLN